ncbi:hypothetical protein NLI96_g7454 [Meripilus lineatus]|uniref:Uncharacterized protein n=1 Tax=Meripilus lineatus TaxID=2056292 RepID=A0AAD5V1B7_9APHY|nr:hypothetical protein NLI96_g7454 [Physisporinus lineatus]
MAYQYYQTAHQGWGSAPVQFGAPPVPTFQPTPAWGGWDYYNAHAINPDRSLWHSIYDRVRSFTGNGGMSRHRARSWHTRIYSGLVNLGQVLPAEIGAAAAYEAYRNWRHHHSVLYSPLGGRREREREALAGMAVAEATRLWQYSGRSMDTYGLRAALESAALTASRISYRVMMDDRDDVMSRRSDSLDDTGSDYSYGHRHRHSSFSDDRLRPPVVVAGAPSMSYGTPLTNTMPITGGVGSVVGAGSVYNGVQSAYGVPQTILPGTVGSVGGVYPGTYNNVAAQYGTLPGAYGQTAFTAPYTSGGLLANPYGGIPATGGYAASYAGAPVAGATYASPYGGAYQGGAYQGQGPTVITIAPSRRRHHHRHRSH